MPITRAQVADTLMAFGTAPELAYNAMTLLAANMTTFKTRTFALPLPDTEKFTDEGDIGVGVNGGFMSEQTSGFVNPPGWDINNRVDSGTFLQMLRRHSGGVDTVVALEPTVAFQHSGGMLVNDTAVGRQLPSSTFAMSNNGADYLWGGVCGNSMQIGQQGAGDPMFTWSVLGSGLYRRIRNLAPAFGNLVLPLPQPKTLGPDSVLEFTDDNGNVVFTSGRQMVNFSITLANNLDMLKLAGASRVDPLDITKGWYLDELLHKVQTSNATMRVFLDDQMRAFDAAQRNKQISGFKYRMYGYEVAGTRAVVVDPALDTLTLAGHGFVLDQVVRVFGTTIPAPLVAGQAYYVTAPVGNTFKLAAAPAGAPIDITTAGAAVAVRGTQRNMVEISYNRCYFNTGGPAQDDNGNAVIDINVRPAIDNVNFGIWFWRAINGSAAVIV
jgi:hypothetical protein